MFKNLLEEFRSLLKSDGLQTQTELLKSSSKYFIVVILFLVTFSANAIDYYISNSGNDANSGTTPDQAWKTLNKVNSFVPNPGDKILFNRGDEWVGTIKVNASGRLGNNIVYGAYGTGEKPKIYGSELITGWTKYSGNIYKATFDKNFSQLFIDDISITLARYPNIGYFKVNSTDGKSYISSNNFNQAFSYSGANIFVRTTAWSIESETVSSQSGNTIYLSDSYYNYNTGEGFFLNNKLDFLDEAGEWYYDRTTNTVYLWTENGDSPANYTVRGSTINNGVTSSSARYITIDNLDIRQQNTNSIYLTNCDYITIDNCIINSPGMGGILLENGASNNVTISNNTIEGASQYGIKMHGTDHSISDNTVKNIGLFENVGANGFGHENDMIGIYVLSGNTTVSYNNLSNIGYNGIRLSFAPNCIVEYNYIYNSCFQKDDGGAIYTWNSSLSDPGCENTVIRYNIIDYVPGAESGFTLGRGEGYGIYLDDYSHTITVENNTVAHTSSANIFTHHGENNTFRYNTCFDGRWGLWTQSGGTGHTFTHNTVYCLNEDMDGYFREVLVGYRYISGSPSYDYNTYIDHYRSSDVFRIEGEWYNFADWKTKTGQDANSTVDHSALADGEYEKLFYNNTKRSEKIDLGSTAYRDIYGNTVSGSITLEPFTSKILIKKSSDSSSSNLSPSIQNQAFNVTGDLTTNQFIGQVVASDPDDGQILTYSILSGNDEALFYIDSSTGDIYSNSESQISQDKLLELTIEVTDNAVEPLSNSATITVNITAESTPIIDVLSPTITSFSIPSTSSSLTVSITSFEASDDQSVDGYLLTESSTVPSIDIAGWTNSVPTEYTFTLEGKNVLYAWAKDAAGNISASVNSTVTIALPDLSATSSAYLFEESSGDIAIDSEGSNDGTLTNEKIRVSGAKKQGLEFTGSGYITMGQCYGVNVQNEVSLSAWIKPSVTSTGWQGIIMHGGPNIDSYALYIYPNTKAIGFKTTGTSSPWLSIDNIESLWDGNWHHLVVTYDGAEKTIYLDNEVLLKAASTGSLESGEGYNLLVAAGRDETTPTLLYEGLIDEVRIYNYAINNTDVSKLYNIFATDTVYTEENIYICEGESYQGWTEPGQYERTLQSSGGGDSIVTTNLYVYPTYDITEDITVKKGESYEGWTESGQYQRSLTTVNGCDSMVTTNLTVLAPTYSTEDVEICYGESYEGWTESGQYERTLEASTGADSIVITNLNVHPTFDITEDVTIKENENYEGWTESGQYQRALTTVYGCDSIVTTNLTVMSANENTTVYTEEDIYICEGESYEGWTESSQYSRTLQSSSGHDSIVTTNLYVYPSYNITEDVAIIEGESYEGWTQTGQYQRMLTSVYGCDSIVTTNLTVMSANELTTVYTEEDIYICEGESYEGWTESGTYERMLQSSSGGDSIVTTNLWVNPTYEITEDITIKEGENYKGWTDSGQYQRVLASINGCDSIITTNLTVLQPITQSIQLDKGWNVFSSFVIPTDPKMEAVHASLDNGNMLNVVEDEQGGTYEKKGNLWINNIGDVQQTEGYKINVKNPSLLTITGYPVILPLEINLNKGKNLMSFPYMEAVDAMKVIQPLIDKGVLIKVQDEKGNSIEYWESLGWVNSIGNFKTGEGYFVQVNNNCVLTILDKYEKSDFIEQQDLVTEYFSVDYIGNGSDHMNINILDIVQSGLEKGDEIAAFDGNICTGAIKLSDYNIDNNTASVRASVSDEGILNGFTEGNRITLIIWKKSTQEVVEYGTNVIEGSMVYNKLGSVLAHLSKANTTSVQKIKILEFNMYPNPAANFINIEYSSLPESNTNIQIMDASGQLIYAKEAASIKERIDVSNFPSGMYYIKSVNSSEQIIKKLIKR